MKLTFAREGAAVDVRGDDATLSWLMRRGENGYLSVVADGSASWVITAGVEHATPGNWVSTRRSYPSGETCEFLVDAGRQEIVVNCPPGGWRHLYTLRMVRNALRWQLFHQKGALFLHGSCLARKGQGLALLGPSRSGKSTLMLSGLRSGSWDYVTEDDLTLLPSDGGFVALGWPGSLRVRRGMLGHYPELAAALPTLEHPANDLEAKLDPETAMVRVFPEELARIFGCAIRATTRLKWCALVEWGARTRVIGTTVSEQEKFLDRSWDILPERRAGAPIPATGSPWISQVFDRFFLEHHGVPDLACFRDDLKRVANVTKPFNIQHSSVDSPLIWTSHCWD